MAVGYLHPRSWSGGVFVYSRTWGEPVAPPTVQNDDSGGDGYPRRKRKPRPPRFDDELVRWIEDIAHPKPQLRPAHIVAAAAEAEQSALKTIAPYVEPGSDVDLEELFASSRRAETLRRLYDDYLSAMQDEEEMALIAMMMAD